MATKLFKNNATTTLASAITSTATSCTVTSGGGALFPTLGSAGPTGTAQNFTATIIKNGNPAVYEVVLVTARSTDTMTIVRAQEGTTAQAWNAGDTLALLPTTADLVAMVQFDDLQAQDTNYAVNTGPANAYVAAMTPALTAHVAGMPIRVLMGSGVTNTGASTFNDGGGVASVVYPNGGALVGGEILANSIATFTWNPTLAAFQLINTPSLAATTFTGTLTGGFSANPSGTINAKVTNGVVTLWNDAAITGTSNGTFLYLTGLPAALTPSGNACFGVNLVVNNSVDTLALAQYNGSNTIAFTLLQVSGSLLTLPSLGQFTSSGTKGLQAGWNISYPLT